MLLVDRGDFAIEAAGVGFDVGPGPVIVGPVNLILTSRGRFTLSTSGLLAVLSVVSSYMTSTKVQDIRARAGAASSPTAQAVPEIRVRPTSVRLTVDHEDIRTVAASLTSALTGPGLLQ